MHTFITPANPTLVHFHFSALAVGKMFRAAYLFAALSLAAVRIASAKDVFAHFMMQNAYAYDVGQWETDIAAAQQIGIDGFALNWVPPNCQDDLSWQAARIDDAYTAAAQMNFKLMLSFDMSWTSCSIYWNQTYMAQSISRYSGSPATYRWNSNVLVSTYGGDTVSQYGNQFFQGLKDMMKSYCAITLSPALTSYASNAQTSATQAASSLVSDYPSIDGYLNWQAWPLNVQQNITATPDLAFQSQMKQAGRTGPYIMGESSKGGRNWNWTLTLDSSRLSLAVQGPKRRQPSRLVGGVQRHPVQQPFQLVDQQPGHRARHHRAADVERFLRVALPPQPSLPGHHCERLRRAWLDERLRLWHESRAVEGHCQILYQLVEDRLASARLHGPGRLLVQDPPEGGRLHVRLVDPCA